MLSWSGWMCKGNAQSHRAGYHVEKVVLPHNSADRPSTLETKGHGGPLCLGWLELTYIILRENEALRGMWLTYSHKESPFPDSQPWAHSFVPDGLKFLFAHTGCTG